jgi:hypothetical protein
MQFPEPTLTQEFLAGFAASSPLQETEVGQNPRFAGGSPRLGPSGSWFLTVRTFVSNMQGQL